MSKAILTCALAATLTVVAVSHTGAADSPAAVVIKWNQLLQSTLPQPEIR